MIVTEIEDIENIEQSLSCYGETLHFSVRIEDKVFCSAVEKRIFIGNKRIGRIISGGERWNVIENEGQNKVPFVELVTAIIYILKEEGYL